MTKSRFFKNQKSTTKVIFICLTITASVTGFYVLALLVSSDATLPFDSTILQAFRSADGADPIGPPWLEEAARDITALGSIAVLIVITVTVSATLYFIELHPRAIVLLCVALIALASSSGLKQVFDRARPDLVDHQTRVFTRSFPSAHAMNSSAVYLTVGALLAGMARKKRVKTVCLFIASAITFLIGTSRIYLGVHWPTDVLAGWLGGIIIALASVLAGQYITDKKLLT